MARLQDKYTKDIAPALAKRFSRDNVLSLPRIQKIVLNMGVGKAIQDKNRMEQAAEQLTLIAGQKVQITKSRVAVSGFRLRENQEIGCRVTLRGKRMYEFLDRLINVALPRIRDFRGVNPKSFDGNGNYSMGVSEEILGRALSCFLCSSCFCFFTCRCLFFSLSFLPPLSPMLAPFQPL